MKVSTKRPVLFIVQNHVKDIVAVFGVGRRVPYASLIEAEIGWVTLA